MSTEIPMPQGVDPINIFELERKIMTPAITYYAAWPLIGGPATAVFKFFDDTEQMPGAIFR